MDKPNILFENIIRFPKTNNPAVLKYKVIVIENSDNAISEYILKEIENTNIINPVLFNIPLQYKGYSSFQLDDDTYVSSSCPISVIKNGENIPYEYIHYNEDTNILSIDSKHVSLNREDKLEALVYKNQIELIHNTNKECQYRIEVLYNPDFILGSHSLLR